MKTKHSIWKNKLAKTMSLVTAILVAALFLGSAATTGIAQNTTPTENTKITASSQVDVASIGKAPHVNTITKIKNPGAPFYEPFYAVNDDSDMFGSFVPSDPGAFTDIAPATPSGFIQNACFILDIYYVVDAYGGLYTVDTTTGVFTSVGPTGVTDTMGLAYDDTTGQMFMTAGTYTNGKLYSVDLDTGAATLIGTLGNTGFAMISIVCDNDGQLYGAEIVTAGSDGMFYSIDKATGAATPIGSVGFSMNYGQDMDYDKDNDILYFCAFNYNTFMPEFRTIDKTTGMSTFVANLAGQTTGFGIPYESPVQYPNDISIQSIAKPGTGNAAPITPIVKVKNVGLNPQTNVPVQLLISKEVITGMVDDFEATDGGYTHAAKNPGTDVWQWGVPTSGPFAAHSGSNVWATNLAGQYPPNMWCYLLSAPFTVPSGAMLNFWHWYYFESSWDGGNVKISSDGGMTWTLITPEGGYPGVMSNNPYMTGQPAYNGPSSGWKQAFFDLTAYEGLLVQLMWECASDGSIQYDGWYIDDVGFTQSSFVNEYDQTMTIASIAPDEVVNLTFPVWTPSGLGSIENVNVNFRAEAINLFPDENVNNDYKAKDFTLHYGFLNDVKVNEIVSPVSGMAESQIPEVIIENVGQLDQTASVNMVINKITYGAEWKVWNPSGGNTWVRDTTGPRTGVGDAKCTYEYTALPNDDWLATPGNVVAPGGVFSFWVHGYVYNDDTYQVWISTTGNTIDDFLAGTMLFSGIAPTAYTLQSFDLSAYEGQTVYCGIFYNGNYAWYIWVDDVTLPDGTFEGFEGTIFPPKLITLTPEYDQTATVSIAAGETKSVTLPVWVPADLPVFMNIDYQADVEVTLGGFNAIYNYGFEDWVPPQPPIPPTPFVSWGFETWPDGWTQSDTGWVQYSYNPTGGTGMCAELPYYSAADGEWFMSPAVDTTTQGNLVLGFKTYIDWYSGADTNFHVYTRADSGDSWTERTPWTNPITYNVLWSGSIDISDDIGTGTQVEFVFNGVPFDFDYWYIDDVVFGSGGAPGADGYWPAFNQYYYGTTTPQWFGVTTGEYPTCSPTEGIYMAEYNSWDILSGNSAELDGTVLIDFTTATQMKFDMYHGTYNAGDVIYPLLSVDGTNFWYDGNQGFYQYDGTTGWKTETMDYSFLISYLGGPGQYYIGFYAISDFGYNMFIDNIKIGNLGEIPDGDPSNNFMSKMFTLSYIHDVGVTAITEWPQVEKRDLIWDNDLTYGEALLACQFDGTNDLGSCADDFQFTEAMDITDLTWVGGFWNGAPGQPDWTITIYSDASGPGDIVYGPVTIPYANCNEQFLEQSGTTYYYSYAAALPDTVVCNAGTYWIGFQAQMAYPPQSGMAGHTAPQQLSEMMFKSAYFGYPDWVPGSSVFGTVYDLAFQLNGQAHGGGGGGNPPPGTYPIAGTIQNIGVTYTETDIPVNAQVTNDTGVVVYDQTIIIAGPLTPGAVAVATFPDITIPWEVAAEGDYKLTMQTQLASDENPANNKKVQNFIIQIPDTTPPTTTASVSGTMGQEGWYVSNVQVTLTATDAKWPMGVNHTYYKVDNGEWTEYTAPIIVETDGHHTVYFYSDDKAVPPNVEETKNVTFKMDKTAPVINSFTATAQNAMKNKWLLECDATDVTSGIVLVEFYADDALVGNATAVPYSFEVDGKIKTAQCIVYDAAGNSKMSDVVNSYNVDAQSQNLQTLQTLQQLLRR